MLDAHINLKYVFREFRNCQVLESLCLCMCMYIDWCLADGIRGLLQKLFIPALASVAFITQKGIVCVVTHIHDINSD